MSTTDKSLTIVFDADCGFCSAMALQWANRLGENKASLIPGQSRPEFKAQMEAMNSWLVITPEGQQFYRFDGILEIMKRATSMQWMVPVLSLFPFRLAGNLGYRLVSNNRQLISKLFFKNAVCKVS